MPSKAEVIGKTGASPSQHAAPWPKSIASRARPWPPHRRRHRGDLAPKLAAKRGSRCVANMQDAVAMRAHPAGRHDIRSLRVRAPAAE